MKIQFLWFLIMIVFFNNFCETFYKSLELSINFPYNVMTKKLFCIFDPKFKLLLWQNQKSSTKSYYFRKSSICKKWLFMLTFIKILTNSYAISTWPQAPSGRSIYWPLTLTFKILALTNFEYLNEQTVHCAWLCC